MINTIGDLKKIINKMDDDFKIEIRVRQKLSEAEIVKSLYPYPFHTDYTTLEFDDIGYSDKVLCLGCEIK
jgi:hypothetical protein